MTDTPPPPPAPTTPQMDSPFRIDQPELVDPMVPVKTKVRPVAVEALLDDFFPGAMQHKKDRIGGRTYTIKVWRYTVEISVTLEAMTEVEASGDATFTFTEHPPGKKPPVIIDQFTSGDLGEIREAIENARGYLMGIVQAITKATTPKPKAPPVNILDED